METQEEQQVPKKKKNLKVLWIVLSIVLVLGLAAGGLALWRGTTRTAYVEGLSAYSQIDAETAIEKFEQVSKAPEFFGDYILTAEERLAEVESFQQAKDSWENGEYATALEQFTAFVETYDESPFLAECRDAVSQIPFEWAQQAIDNQDYETAVEIFRSVIEGDYPGVVKIDMKNSLPGVLLEWGDYLVGQENHAQAVEVYSEAYDLTVQSEELETIEAKVRETYQTLVDDAREANEFETTIGYYHELADWLEENSLNGYIEAREMAAETALAWGDSCLEQEDYENAILHYEEVLATEIAKYGYDASENRAEAYMVWGDRSLAAGEDDTAVEKYLFLIENYGDIPTYTDFSEEAVVALLAHAKDLVDLEEYESANLIFNSISAIEVSAEVQIDIYLNWGISLYATGTHHNYLESMRNLAAAMELAQDEDDADLIAEVEEVQAEVIQTVSELEDGLGRLILDAAEAEYYETKSFPVCREIEDEELCLDDDDFPIIALTLGVNEEIDLFLYVEDLPEDLVASTPGEAEFYVLFVRTSTVVETCDYYSGNRVVAYLERRRVEMAITIYRAQDGTSLAQTSYKGGDPPTCPSWRSFSSVRESVFGSDPDYGKIYLWLRDYAVTGE